MTEFLQIIAAGSALLVAYCIGRGHGIADRPASKGRIDTWPTCHVRFGHQMSDVDRLIFLDQSAQAVRDGRLRPSSIKFDEESRAAYYELALKNGSAQPESHSTSSRNSRGPK